jgi:serine/threonine protein kinase
MPVDARRLKELFVVASELPPAERAAWLDRECGGDAELRQRLEGLLRAHDDSGGFLAQPATVDPAPGNADSPVSLRGKGAGDEGEAIGTRIGPYKLLQKLGEGGMGTVWVAEQSEPVKRRVALKLIKAGMDSAQVLRRFEAERQALALMDHTNIAKVFDGGQTGEPRSVSSRVIEGDDTRELTLLGSPRPYFVMELVKGVPITKYCDELHLPIKERLELFMPVCAAIQHAHQKGIIHRDIKPSNVLACMQDGKPVPKVIDFGVAKALHQRLTDESMYTEIGQIVGTLEYMSPEQAELSTLDIDMRADVYALGVLLYELLTGTTPLSRKRLNNAAFVEMLRIIREEEPQKPSTRLTESKESLASLAAQRRTEPAKLMKAVRGELDWIVMKCLEKDRTRRYETASSLARDVERHLADEPVDACPPSARYRLGKFLRRHRGPVLAASLILLALVGGIVGTTWGLIRAEGQRQKAETAAEQEREAKEREAEQRALAETKRQEAEDQKKRAEQQKQRAEEKEKEARKQQQIAEAVRTFLQHDLLRQADATEQADTLLPLGGRFEAKDNPTIKELLERAAGELTPAKIEAKFPSQREVQASILRTVGDTYRGIGEYGKAVEFLTRASDLYRAAFGFDNPDSLRTLNHLAMAYRANGNVLPAIELYEQIRAAIVKKQGVDHIDTLLTLANLATAYLAAGKPIQAIKLFEQARDGSVKTQGADHLFTLAILNNLAQTYMAAGQVRQAIKLGEQVRDMRAKKLGVDHPYTLITRCNLAGAYLKAGELPWAIALFQQVLDAQKKKLGADHPNTLTTLNNLALAYRAAGKLPEAIALLEQVRDASVKKLGVNHPDTLITLDSLAVAYHDFGKLPQAIKLFEQVRDVQLKTLGANHPHTLSTLTNLAAAYKNTGKVPLAIQLYKQAWNVQVKTLGADHPDTLFTLHYLAGAYRADGKLSEAIALFKQVHEARATKLGAEHTDTLITLNNLATAYYAFGKPSKAIELLKQAHDSLVKKLGAGHPHTLLIGNNLAQAYQGTGKPEQALPLIRQAAEEYEKQKFLHPDSETAVGRLSACHEQLMQYSEAEAWQRKWLAAVKEQAGDQSPTYAGGLVLLGVNLLKQKKWTEAERVASLPALQIRQLFRWICLKGPVGWPVRLRAGD